MSRRLASVGAALILLAQLVGAAHYHIGVTPRGPAVAAQSVADTALCPVCQLAFHSPASFTSVPVISYSMAIVGSIAPIVSIALESPVLRAQRSRAPPATV